MDFIAPDHELTEDIIRCAVEVHRVIGPGLKEEVYEAALEWELVHAGHQVARQVACPVTDKGVRLETKRERRICLPAASVRRNRDRRQELIFEG